LASSATRNGVTDGIAFRFAFFDCNRFWVVSDSEMKERNLIAKTSFTCSNKRLKAPPEKTRGAHELDGILSCHY
jgi:hypothetical protein